MAAKETQTVDSKARVTLPKGFAKATVVLEQVSETEVRIHLAGDRTKFAEESVPTLSDRDRERFLKLLENAPPPNAALRKAMSKHRTPISAVEHAVPISERKPKKR